MLRDKTDSGPVLKLVALIAWRLWVIFWWRKKNTAVIYCWVCTPHVVPSWAGFSLKDDGIMFSAVSLSYSFRFVYNATPVQKRLWNAEPGTPKVLATQHMLHSLQREGHHITAYIRKKVWKLRPHPSHFFSGSCWQVRSDERAGGGILLVRLAVLCSERLVPTMTGELAYLLYEVFYMTSLISDGKI